MKRQHFQVDEYGNIIGSDMLDPEVDLIPGDFIEAWGSSRNLNQPVYDFDLGDWVETVDEQEILEDLKIAKKEQVNTNVRLACLKGFTSPTTGHTYETETHDQENFSRRWQVVSTFPSKYTSVPWKTADGKIVEHTVEDFITLCGEIDDFITSTVNKGWYIKAEIDKAQSLPELEQIILEVE